LFASPSEALDDAAMAILEDDDGSLSDRGTTIGAGSAAQSSLTFGKATAI